LDETLGLGGVPAGCQPCGPAGLWVCIHSSCGECGPLGAGLREPGSSLESRAAPWRAGQLWGGSTTCCPYGSGWGLLCSSRAVGAMCVLPRRKLWHCLPATVAILPVGRGTCVGTAAGSWRLTSHSLFQQHMGAASSLPPQLSPWKHQQTASRKGGTFLIQHLCVQLPALQLVCCSVTHHSSSPVSLWYATRSCCTSGYV